MIRLLAVAVAMSLPLSAYAQTPRPALRPVVAVASEFVTVGDLVENAGADAAHPLFHAPDLGASGTIQTWRVVEALRAFGIDNVAVRGLSQVRVERIAKTVSELELREVAAQALMQRLAITDPTRLEMRLDTPTAALTFDAPETAPVTVERVVHDAVTGRFEGYLTVPAARQARPVRITGTAIEHIDVVRLRRNLNRGELVNASDLSVERSPRNRVPADVVNAPAEAVGLAARRNMTEGTMPRGVDFERPKVIARNDPVTIVFEAANLVVTARGRAQDGGAAGDVIDVQNTASRRVVQAVIVGPGRVSIRPGQVRRVATAAPSQRH